MSSSRAAGVFLYHDWTAHARLEFGLSSCPLLDSEVETFLRKRSVVTR